MPDWRATLTGSWVLQSLLGCLTLFRTAAETSAVLSVLHSTRNTLWQMASTLLLRIRTASVVRTASAWCHGSAVVRWLTAPGDPATIVLDLRETRTVGLVLAFLDGLVSSLRESRFRPLVARLSHRVRSHPTRTGCAVLALGVLGALTRAVLIGDQTLGALAVWALLLCLVLAGTRAPAGTATRSVVYRFLVVVLAPPGDEPEHR